MSTAKVLWVLPLSVLGLACGLQPSTAQPQASADAAQGESVDAGTDAGTTSVLELPSRVADAQCGALERCCNDGDRQAFFAPFAQDQRLSAELRARVPSSGQLSPSSCRALLRDIADVHPLGPWVRAVAAGRVQFDAAAAETCLAALTTATCGRPVSEALYDSTCFGFSPPEGGAVQRKVFTRTAAGGESCVPLADGVGGNLYGTCDPHRAFCCNRHADGSCGPVSAGTEGVCVAVSQVAQGCNIAPLQLCATGLDCDGHSGTCTAPKTGPLALGATCASGADLLGECVGSWCDFAGTNTCLAYKPDGAVCQLGLECTSGACSHGVCGAPTFCSTP